MPHRPPHCAASSTATPHHLPRCAASSTALRPIIRRDTSHHPPRCAASSTALRRIVRHAAPHHPPCCAASSSATPHHPPSCVTSSIVQHCIYHCFKAHPPQSRNADREDAPCSYRCQPPSHYRSGGARPCIFPKIPMIPPSSVVHSSAPFSFNSQIPYIFVCRKRQILSFPPRRRNCYSPWFRSDEPLPHW